PVRSHYQAMARSDAGLFVFSRCGKHSTANRHPQRSNLASRVGTEPAPCPRSLGPECGQRNGDVPFARMPQQNGTEGRPAKTLTPIGLEDEELGHEKARGETGERALVDYQGKARDLVARINQVREAPEAVQEAVLEAAIRPHGKRHALSHVV